MITEDYVSFETAKLLKEKGFNKYPLFPCYKEDNGEFIDIPTTLDTINYCFIPAPTLQMAMKWLRKEHNLCIVPLPVVTDDDGEGGCLWKYTISMKLKVLFDSGNLYESLEIALDDAIKHCSENLI